MKEYLKTIGISFLPTFLVFIGKSDIFFLFLQKHGFIDKNSDFSEIQLICFVVGLLWTGVIIPVQFAKIKNELLEKEAKFKELLEFNKEIYFKSIKENLKKHNKNLRTRIFVPVKGLKAWLDYKINGKIEFKLKHIDGISDSFISRNIYFEVTPTTQGLVGLAVRDKQIVVDCQVDSNKYNLNKYQSNLTNDVIFCSTSPILNNKDEVKAVLSIDSNDEIQFTEEELKKWIDHIILYCAFVDKHLKI